MFLAIFLGGSFVLCNFYEWVMLDVRSNLLHYIYIVRLAFSALSCVSGKSPRGPVTSYVLAVGYPGGGRLMLVLFMTCYMYLQFPSSFYKDCRLARMPACLNLAMGWRLDYVGLFATWPERVFTVCFPGRITMSGAFAGTWMI